MRPFGYVIVVNMCVLSIGMVISLVDIDTEVVGWFCVGWFLGAACVLALFTWVIH